MAKKKNNPDNLPAKVESFDLTTTSGFELNVDLAAEIDDNDFSGYDASREALPIVSVRQKDLKDDKGNMIFPAGGFKIYDPVTAGTETVIADQPDLTVTILMDQPGRVYWPEGEFDRPACKSLDNKVGIGTPGGDCTVCPLAQFGKDDKGDMIRPKCSAQMNCLVYDHGVGASYILRLGRSALKPYANFKALVRRMSNGQMIPLHAIITKVTLKYEQEPAPHYVPVFTPDAQLSIDLFKQFKLIRSEYVDVMARTVEVDTPDDEHPAHDDQPTDGGGDLPPGVEPVQPETKGDDDLPF